MKEAKKILKETNETLNELRESLQSFFEIRIEKSLEKTKQLKMKQFGNYSSLLKDCDEVFLIFEKKKNLIKKISILLEEELEIKNLEILKILRKEIEDLQLYKTNDPSEKDILELMNTTITLMEEILQMEVENNNRQKNVLLSLETVLTIQNGKEIEIFLKKNKHLIPKEKYEEAKSILHQLKHSEEIRLQDYLNDKILNLELKEKPRYLIKNEQEEKKRRDSQGGEDSGDDYDSLKQNGSVITTKEQKPDNIPPVLNTFHKSVIKLLKLINEKKQRLFIVTPIEPFRNEVEKILNSILELLSSHRYGGGGLFSAKPKSILEIVKPMETTLVNDFLQVSFFNIEVEVENNSRIQK
jgi:hypothetical protein